MKDFILDLTYRDSTIVNSNDDTFTVPTSNLPYNSIPHHTINLNRTNSNYNAIQAKNEKFNAYNLIDYL